MTKQKVLLNLEEYFPSISKHKGEDEEMKMKKREMKGKNEKGLSTSQQSLLPLYNATVRLNNHLPEWKSLLKKKSSYIFIHKYIILVYLCKKLSHLNKLKAIKHVKY